MQSLIRTLGGPPYGDLEPQYEQTLTRRDSGGEVPSIQYRKHTLISLTNRAVLDSAVTVNAHATPYVGSKLQTTYHFWLEILFNSEWSIQSVMETLLFRQHHIAYINSLIHCTLLCLFPL